MNKNDPYIKIAIFLLFLLNFMTSCYRSDLFSEANKKISDAVTDTDSDTNSDTNSDSQSEIHITNLSPNKTRIVVGINEKQTIIITVEPSGASTQWCTWSSSNPAIAQVNSEGEVQGCSAGEAVITIADGDSGCQTSCSVQVKATGTPSSVNADGISFSLIFMRGGITFPVNITDTSTAYVDHAFFIGQTEVTYELWYSVRNWAENDAVPAYSFDNKGRAGNNGIDGAIPSSSDKNQPVTYINWRDAMIWCNALTEWLNTQTSTQYKCVYYYDAEYDIPIRDSKDDDTHFSELGYDYSSLVNTTPGGFDLPYIDPDADGFALPTLHEWQLAARYISDDGDSYLDAGEYYPGNHVSGDTSAYCYPNDGGTSTQFGNYAWYNGNASNSHIVGTAGVGGTVSCMGYTNALGLFDMSGNVCEWIFDWQTVNSTKYGLGGSFFEPEEILQTAAFQYKEPYYKLLDTGIRIIKHIQ